MVSHVTHVSTGTDNKTAMAEHLPRLGWADCSTREYSPTPAAVGGAGVDGGLPCAAVSGTHTAAAAGSSLAAAAASGLGVGVEFGVDVDESNAAPSRQRAALALLSAWSDPLRELSEGAAWEAGSGDTATPPPTAFSSPHAYIRTFAPLVVREAVAGAGRVWEDACGGRPRGGQAGDSRGRYGAASAAGGPLVPPLGVGPAGRSVWHTASVACENALPSGLRVLRVRVQCDASGGGSGGGGGGGGKGRDGRRSYGGAPFTPFDCMLLAPAAVLTDQSTTAAALLSDPRTHSLSVAGLVQQARQVRQRRGGGDDDDDCSGSDDDDGDAGGAAIAGSSRMPTVWSVTLWVLADAWVRFTNSTAATNGGASTDGGRAKRARGHDGSAYAPTHSRAAVPDVCVMSLGALVTPLRELEALYSVVEWEPHLLAHLLSGVPPPPQPGGAGDGDGDDGGGARQWSNGKLPLSSSFVRGYLRTAFNPSQVAAITAAAASPRAVTLVQGPPGTGKTVTLVGMLNTLHLSLLASWFASLAGHSPRRVGVAAAAAAAAPPLDAAGVKDEDADDVVEVTAGASAAAAVAQGWEPPVPPVVAARRPLPQSRTPGAAALAALTAEEYGTPPPLGQLVTSIQRQPPRGDDAMSRARAALDEFLTPPPSDGSAAAVSSSSAADVLLHLLQLHQGRPRLLVTAPSNTAADGIVRRILEHKFVSSVKLAPAAAGAPVGAPAGPASASTAASLLREDGDDAPVRPPAPQPPPVSVPPVPAPPTPPVLEHYVPAIVRVGDGAAEDIRASGVHLETEVNKHAALSPADLATAAAAFAGQVAAAEAELMKVRGALASGVCQRRDAVAIVYNLVRRVVAARGCMDRVCTLQDAAGRARRRAGGRPLAARDAAELQRSLLDASDIVVSTTSSAALAVLARYAAASGRTYDVVVVDEAAQATEPAALVPLQFCAGRVVLVGDPAQLGATLLSQSAAAAGLRVSLFERLVAAGTPATLLNEQYRSHPAIAAFSATAFYGGRLLNARSVTGARRASPLHATRHFGPLLLLDVSAGQEASAAHAATTPAWHAAGLPARLPAPPSSLVNLEEALTLVRHLRALAAWRGVMPAPSVGAAAGAPRPSLIFRGTVGILSYYRGQVVLLQHLLDAAFPPTAPAPFRWDVATVDGFQGQERDVVLISTVRTAALGFVDDPRRMNVALTRAKFCCWVAASARTLATATVAPWPAFVAHVVSAGGLVPCTPKPASIAVN